MKKLVEINVACNLGSTGRIAEQVGILANRHGWKVYIAHGTRYVAKSELNTIRIGSWWEERLHGIKSLLFDGHGLGSRRSTAALIKELDLIKPDIIHLHNLHGYYINYRLLFEYLAYKRIPVIWTLHDCWPFTGHCTYFDRIGCQKWKDLCNHCPQKNTYPKSLTDRASKNFSLKKRLFTRIPNLTIVPVSDWLNKLVQKSFLAKYPVRTIHNGIDLECFRPTITDFRKKNTLEGKFVVLGVANGYGQRKGLLDFNTLSERLGQSTVVVMVGLSDGDWDKISARIIGIGRTSSLRSLVDIYSSADVYLNPTYEDNFPTTNLEALACGTPVITYNTGGSPEAIDENTGIVVEKGDIEGLIRAIETVKNNGKDFYSQACRNRAEQLFNKDKQFEEYLRLFEEISQSITI